MKPLDYSQEMQGVIVELRDVTFTSPEKVLFYDLNVVAAVGDTIALIGKSGVGKSSLLRLIVGGEKPDEGAISLNPRVKVSYVPQDIVDLEVDPEISIGELFYSSRGLAELDKKKSALEAKMENGDLRESTLNAYSDLLEVYEAQGGYIAESEIGKILTGLKLDEKSTGHITLATQLDGVSSGQRTRILIGQALFATPGLLVMDDPTSHLDVGSVAWLGNYLRGKTQTAIVATNNTQFINACCNKIVELTDFGRVITFKGNYDEYVIKRDTLLEAERLAAISTRKRIEQLQATYMKFKSEGVFQRSESMAKTGKALESRIERMQNEYAEMPGSQQVNADEKVPPLVFKAGKRSGDDILAINGLVKRYSDYPAVFLPDFKLKIRRGEIILLYGENGSGKSTFLRTIANILMGGGFTPDEGSITPGSSLMPVYYAPDDTGISHKGRILDDVMEAMPTPNPGEASNILRFFGFSRKIIYMKTIETLSMGEKKQLALAKLMAQRPNILLLDEPTDYLKEEIIERLVAAIKGFDGTVLLISHNTAFINSLPITAKVLLPKGTVEILSHDDRLAKLK
jgi:ATP-binding cassette, subfamily F, member 3